MLFIRWINEVVSSGARLLVACREVELSLLTWRRWQQSSHDRRSEAVRSVPANKQSPDEEMQIISVCHQPEYASLPPSQIVPKLVDNGIYRASESTFYRVLHRNQEAHRWGREQ